MVDRIAHQMDQWVPQDLVDRLVHRHVIAVDEQSDLLALLRGEIACDPSQTIGHRGHRLQACLHHRVLQFPSGRGELVEGVGQCAVIGDEVANA